MRDEAAFKTHFKKSVRAQGGFSISLAAPMLPGTPDLYCVLPGFAPVLLEAKWMKEITHKTNVQIPITAMQKHVIDSCNNVYPGIAHCLIGYKYDKHCFAALLPTNGRITLGAGRPVSIFKQSEFFDVRTLFKLYVPKMQVLYQTKPLTEPNVSVTIGVPKLEAENELPHT